MELALNTLFIFLFIVFPGIVFRRMYYVGEFSKQFNSSSWINSIFISLIPGIFIQAITFFTYNNVVSKVDTSIINEFYSTLAINQIPSLIYDPGNIISFAVYTSIMLLVSALAAQTLYMLVRGLDWDKKFSILRFQNHWHYYFKGEATKFKDFRDVSPHKRIGITEADILVQATETETKLYKGFLRQHSLDPKTGDLMNIYLTDVMRYSNSKGEFVEVPGDLLILPNDRIININLKYIPREKVDTTFLLPLLSLIVLILLMMDVFNLFERLDLWAQILGRFILFLDWLFIFSLLSTFVPQKEKKKKKSMTYARVGLLGFIALFTFLVYYMAS